MPNLFTPRADLILRASLLALVLTLGGGVATMFVHGRPTVEPTVGRIRSQPVPFSHEHHVGRLGLDCRYCHTGAQTSDFAGMPASETCMGCHLQLYDTAPPLEPVRESWATNQPIRWNRVYRLPDFVRFSHKVHVLNGIACISCHGRMDEQPLTQLQNSLSMGWCLNCHRHPRPNLVDPAAVFELDAARFATPQAPLVDRRDTLLSCSACHY